MLTIYMFRISQRTVKSLTSMLNLTKFFQHLLNFINTWFKADFATALPRHNIDYDITRDIIFPELLSDKSKVDIIHNFSGNGRAHVLRSLLLFVIIY